ncbi:MAG: tRNA-intron lyase [Candidatus Woesearchaeota archaeon]|nr:tRNA-intron lyase [Candidatus Woesearchaeota archaeon]MDP7181802.1 tRNA-intron lyase [Candidatus Woesearchaeota archaeon]MDP7198891.1 tRNA-intron lyase [Candidatus Woesearchaeota archaeon]MDP7467109.1 tRNA-intron lyase [Candidatus Woesearchaeota archaeon]MDP7647556.1 tRNA-intron lyase [Candidatus Woesearchaeota archaeon]
MTKAFLDRGRIITEASDAVRALATLQYGTSLADGRLHLSLFEAMFLVETEKLEVVNARGKAYSAEQLVRSQRPGKSFWTHYAVFKDLRGRGYVVKTALKFGAAFRVYDRGKKPGQAHAKWVVFPVHEQDKLTWHDWAAKNRVAHSTKKKLLIGVVDDELDVCYWEARWLKP